MKAPELGQREIIVASDGFGGIVSKVKDARTQDVNVSECVAACRDFTRPRHLQIGRRAAGGKIAVIKVGLPAPSGE